MRVGFARACAHVWLSLIGNIAPVSSAGQRCQRCSGSHLGPVQFFSDCRSEGQCLSRITAEETGNDPGIILLLIFVSHVFSPFLCMLFSLSLSPPPLCCQTLSGDSTINPALGRLVLQSLCPALHSLLTDGLKPHQSDLIAGRRPNSAWGLIQASTRPGSKTKHLVTSA